MQQTKRPKSMDTTITCPTCKEKFDIQPDQCPHCGYPFTGTQQEQSVFIGQQILKKGKLSDTKDRINRARNIIWIIGALNIIAPFVAYTHNPLQGMYIVSGIVLGLVFIGCGFLSYKKPLAAILVPMVLLLFSYTVNAIVDPFTLIQGILWKVLFITALSYALVNILQSNKIKKESNFLKSEQ
jgi:ribosomal protein L37E